MGRNMIKATRTHDHDLIKSIMTSRGLWETVAEDGHLPADFTCDTESECWLLMTSGDDVVGLYNIHGINAITCEIHAQVIPKHREKHSYDTGKAALAWIFNEAPEYKKVIAQIPVVFENVKNFTCQFGFQVEGTNRLSYLKDGAIVDQWLLGMTRDEIEVFLDE